MVIPSKMNENAKVRFLNVSMDEIASMIEAIVLDVPSMDWPYCIGKLCLKVESHLDDRAIAILEEAGFINSD